MNKTIEIGRLKIIYDLEIIIDEVLKWEYNKDSYDGKGEVDTVADYSVSEEKWTNEKEAFLKEIKSLEIEENLRKEIIKTIKTNKNGSITKNRRNVLINFGAYRDYNNNYGSHAYTIDALMIKRISNFEGRIVLSYYNDQSSF